jgi:hypothetical protein
MNAFDKHESGFYEKLYQYEQYAIQVMSNPDMYVPEYTVTVAEYARELLRINPEYACIINIHLLSNQSVALYTIRTDGHFVEDIKKARGDIHPVYFKYDYARYIRYTADKSLDFDRIYKVIERIVTGSSREAAMELVDKVLEYNRKMGYYPQFDINRSLPYFYQQDLFEKIDKSYCDPYTSLVSYPDEYVYKIIDNLDECIKLVGNKKL